MLAFYDFPAEHWKHLRTTIPIESTLATIRLRHQKTKGIGQVHNITARDGRECSEIRYYLSNMPLGVKGFSSAVRAHWGIENSFHWVLDMTFNED